MAPPLDTDLDLVSPDNAERPPNWRWCVAVQAHAEASAQRPRSRFSGLAAADPLIAGLVRVLNEGDRLGGRESLRTLARQLDRDVGAAYSVYVRDDAADNALPPGRLYATGLRAGILAGAKRASLARAHGLSERAIEVYEAVWFDVRTRLKQDVWVATEVIGTLAGPRLNEADVFCSLVMAYGYYSKSMKAVRMMMRSVDAPLARTLGRTDPARFVVQDGLAAVSAKLAVAARIAPVGGRDGAAKVLEAASRFLAVTGAADASGTTQEVTARTQEALKDLSRRMDWGYGRAPVEGVVGGPPRLADGTAAG